MSDRRELAARPRRLADALGGGVGALLAAALIVTTAAALYLRVVNTGELGLAQTPAVAFASSIAAKSVGATQSPAASVGGKADLYSADQVQVYLNGLRTARPEIKLATVVTEPRSVKYRFLRKRRYLAHSDPARVGQALEATKAGDKTIYDLANTVRQRGGQLEALAATPGATPSLIRAAVPVVVGGKHVAMALCVTEIPKRPPLVRAWPLGLAAIACIVVGLLAGATLPRRLRYASIMLATLCLALFAHLRVEQAVATYGQLVVTTQEALARSLELEASAFAGIARLPGRGTGPLAAAAALALGIGLLGLAGVGARISAALRRNRFAYAYIAPSAIGMAILVLIPFGYGLGLGFFDHAHGRYTFVGLQNFVEILSGGGRPLTHPLNFYFTLGVTVLWTVLNVFLHTSIGLGLALLLKDPLLGFKGVYRVLLVLPWAVPNYITALIWKGMFHQQYGAVNHVLSLFGIEKVSWFSSFSTAFTANLATNTWLGFPFMMVIALGALQSIPKDVYEAAAVDGASPWQTFRRITLPLLRPALYPAIILGSIWTFNMFNIIYLVSQGEPAGATDILITEAYRWAFERADRYGLAAAYAAIIFVILLVYTLITNRMARATEDVLE